MERIAKFEKVSFEQFYESVKRVGGYIMEDAVREWWENIKLPTRATTGSAGYDFYAPYMFPLSSNQWETFPTGIRCVMQPGWVLMLAPKSGLGFKYGVKLRNTQGYVDVDYAYSDNEGHIMAKLSAEETVFIRDGQAFMQGIFLPFGITEDDAADGVRNGGFGSTEKKA